MSPIWILYFIGDKNDEGDSRNYKTSVTTNKPTPGQMLFLSPNQVSQRWKELSYQHSLRFNGHFPGEPGLAGVYWCEGRWRWWWQLDYWSYKTGEAPVKSSPPTNQHPVFYRPGPVCM